MAQLLVAGLAMVAVSFAWIAFVDLTPASKRPYVGSSTNNSELGLTFEYNGLGRVEGQAGGPERRGRSRRARYVPRRRASAAVDDAARVAAAARSRGPPPHRPSRAARPRTATPRARARRPRASTGREKNPIPFGGPPGPLRLFGVGLGDQAGWMLPFALFGLLGAALLAAARPQGETVHEPKRPRRRRSRRRDPRLATAAGTRRVVRRGGGGAEPVQGNRASLLRLGARARHRGDGGGRRRRVRDARPRTAPQAVSLVLVAGAVAATVLAQIVLMHREHYMLWFVPVLLVGAAVGVGAFSPLRRLAAPAVALTLPAAARGPGGLRHHHLARAGRGHIPGRRGQGTSPAPGGYGVNAHDLAIDRALRGLRRAATTPARAGRC